MMEIYPMKYLKVNGGFIALVWALEGPLNVSKKVTIGIGDGIIEARTGQVVLPILDDMLPSLLQTPKIQVSFMTSKLVDDTHMIVELDLPKLYEMKGALGVLRQQQSRPETDRPDISDHQMSIDRLAESNGVHSGLC